jgi:hypothetical protein
MVHLLRERLIVSSARYYPQVNLSIHATLRNLMAARERQLLTSALGSRESKLQESVRKSSSPLVVERVMSREGAAGDSRAIADSGPPALKEPLVFERPLRLVFQRLEKIHEGREAASRERATYQTREMILRRVIDQSQRIESPRPLPPALIIKQAEKSTIEAADSIDRQSATTSTIEQVVSRRMSEQSAARHSTSLTTHAAPWTPSAAPLNVDQIADQVLRRLDRRVEAWRERTGRV